MMESRNFLIKRKQTSNNLDIYLSPRNRTELDRPQKKRRAQSILRPIAKNLFQDDKPRYIDVRVPIKPSKMKLMNLGFL